MSQIDLNVPKIIFVRDYHDFDFISDCLQKLNSKLNCEELDFDGEDYVGIVYYDLLPSFDELLGNSDFKNFIKKQFGLTESGFEEAREWYNER